MNNVTNMNSDPRVSIVMAAYNAEAFIRTAIESALAQTKSNLELLIVDDGSIDGTRAVVKWYCRRDSRVKLITNATRRGPGNARNRGIEAARGEWIAILDADDWYATQRLSTLLAHAQREKAALLADNQLFVRGENFRPHRHLFRAKRSGLTVLTASDLLQNDRIGRTGNLGLLKPIVRRQVLVENGIRYNETLENGEDFYFLLDCLRCVGGLVLTGEPHYFYRIHKKSISSAPSIEKLFPLLDVQKRYVGLFNPAKDPTTFDLMQKRTLELERYIRYKALIVPLKRGELSCAFRRMIDDPAALIFLTRGIGRFVGRRAAIYWSEFRPHVPPRFERARDLKVARETTDNAKLEYLTE